MIHVLIDGARLGEDGCAAGAHEFDAAVFPSGEFGGAGEAVVAVLDVERPADADLAKVAGAEGAIGDRACAAEGGQENGEEQRDDRDADEEFEKGEAAASVQERISEGEMLPRKTDGWEKKCKIEFCLVGVRMCECGRAWAECMRSWALEAWWNVLGKCGQSRD